MRAAGFSKSPDVTPTHRWRAKTRLVPSKAAASEGLVYVEDLNDARTLPGEGRVSARRGRAGEKIDFFSSLLGLFLLVTECR